LVQRSIFIQKIISHQFSEATIFGTCIGVVFTQKAKTHNIYELYPNNSFF